MIKQLCLILFLVLTFSTTALSGDKPSERVTPSLKASTNTEKSLKKETQTAKETPPATKQESDQEEDPSDLDDEFG
ncbi:MAG: hypothetical protein QM483_05910 [Desulfuromusa sp.]